MIPTDTALRALEHWEFLAGHHYHQVYGDGSDGADHLEPIRTALAAAEAAPLDVERLLSQVRDLRNADNTSHDERYDLGWYDGLGAAIDIVQRAALAATSREGEG